MMTFWQVDEHTLTSVSVVSTWLCSLPLMGFGDARNVSVGEAKGTSPSGLPRLHPHTTHSTAPSPSHPSKSIHTYKSSPRAQTSFSTSPNPHSLQSNAWAQAYSSCTHHKSSTNSPLARPSHVYESDATSSGDGPST